VAERQALFDEKLPFLLARKVVGDAVGFGSTDGSLASPGEDIPGLALPFFYRFLGELSGSGVL